MFSLKLFALYLIKFTCFLLVQALDMTMFTNGTTGYGLQIILKKVNNMSERVGFANAKLFIQPVRLLLVSRSGFRQRQAIHSAR